MTTATPAQPATFLPIDTQAPYYKWMIAAIVLTAGAAQTFAGPTINIAIPRLMAAFGTDLAQTQWVATAWLLTRTLVMPLLGWLGGMPVLQVPRPIRWPSGRSAARWMSRRLLPHFKTAFCSCARAFCAPACPCSTCCGGAGKNREKDV